MAGDRRTWPFLLPSAGIDPAGMGIDRIGVAVLRLPRGWHLPPHNHSDRHELILVQAGRLDTVIQGRRVSAGPGRALLYPQGLAHEEWAIRGPLRTVWVSWAGDLPIRTVEVDDPHGRIAEAGRWLADLADDPIGAASVAKALVGVLVHELGRRQRPDDDGLVGRIAAWTVARLDQPLDLDVLADAAGLSRFHFTRRFTAAAGLPPMRWLRHQRVRAARALLLTTDLPLREIAPRVGVRDEFQLSRMFRRCGEAPPGSLRRRSRFPPSD
jgi:AraC-like DNA-binding protein